MSPDPSVLVAQLREALTQQRYNPVVIGNYCRNADYFLSYLATREIALETVTPTDVADYLRLSVRQFRKRHGRAPARYWIGIPRSGIHGLLKLALKAGHPNLQPPTLVSSFVAKYATSIRHGCGSNAGWLPPRSTP